MTEGYVEHQADQGEPWGVSAMSIQLTGNEAAQMPPPSSSSLEHLQKHLEGGNAGAAMFTPAKLAWGQAWLWLHTAAGACRLALLALRDAGPAAALAPAGPPWAAPHARAHMPRDLGPHLPLLASMVSFEKFCSLNWFQVRYQFSASFQCISFAFHFSNYNSDGLAENLTVFIKSLASWICRFMPFAKFGKFNSFISSSTFSISPSFSCCCWNPIKQVLGLSLYFPQVPKSSVHSFLLTVRRIYDYLNETYLYLKNTLLPNCFNRSLGS